MQHFGRAAPPVLRRFPRIRARILAAPTTLRTAFEGADQRATLAAELLTRDSQQALGITERISNVARLNEGGPPRLETPLQLSTGAANIVKSKATNMALAPSAAPADAVVQRSASSTDLFPESSEVRVVARRRAARAVRQHQTTRNDDAEREEELEFEFGSDADKLKRITKATLAEQRAIEADLMKRGILQEDRPAADAAASAKSAPSGAGPQPAERAAGSGRTSAGEADAAGPEAADDPEASGGEPEAEENVAMHRMWQEGDTFELPKDLPPGMHHCAIITRLHHIEMLDSWLGVRRALDERLKAARHKAKGELRLYVLVLLPKWLPFRLVYHAQMWMWQRMLAPYIDSECIYMMYSAQSRELTMNAMGLDNDGTFHTCLIKDDGEICAMEAGEFVEHIGSQQSHVMLSAIRDEARWRTANAAAISGSPIGQELLESLDDVNAPAQDEAKLEEDGLSEEERRRRKIEEDEVKRL